MNCYKFNELINEYMDGTLSSGLISEFEKHGQECAECARELERAKILIGTLPKINYEYPSGLNSRISNGIKAHRRIKLVYIEAAAAILVIAIAIPLYLNIGKGDKKLANYSRTGLNILIPEQANILNADDAEANIPSADVPSQNQNEKSGDIASDDLTNENDSISTVQFKVYGDIDEAKDIIINELDKQKDCIYSVSDNYISIKNCDPDSLKNTLTELGTTDDMIKADIILYLYK